jgi:hypothetical protein
VQWKPVLCLLTEGENKRTPLFSLEEIQEEIRSLWEIDTQLQAIKDRSTPDRKNIANKIKLNRGKWHQVIVYLQDIKLKLELYSKSEKENGSDLKEK